MSSFHILSLLVFNSILLPLLRRSGAVSKFWQSESAEMSCTGSKSSNTETKDFEDSSRISTSVPNNLSTVTLGALGPPRSGTSSFLFRWAGHFERTESNQTVIVHTQSSFETNIVLRTDGSRIALVDFHAFCPDLRRCLDEVPQCHAVLLTFSVADRESFYSMQRLFDCIEFYLDLSKTRSPLFAVVACKCDLERSVTMNEGVAFASRIQSFYFEVSSNWMYTIDEMFRKILTQLEALHLPKAALESFSSDKVG